MLKKQFFNLVIRFKDTWKEGSQEAVDEPSMKLTVKSDSTPAWALSMLQ